MSFTVQPVSKSRFPEASAVTAERRYSTAVPRLPEKPRHARRPLRRRTTGPEKRQNHEILGVRQMDPGRKTRGGRPTDRRDRGRTHPRACQPH
ncbi:unnamed protein product [Ixodes persulcatus]